MAVENFNPIYFLSPIIPIAFSFALIFYWRARRRFRWIVLGYAFAAYVSAIVLKYIVQIATISAVTGRFGQVSVVTALYYGLQTSFFEVGIAYLVAIYAVRKGSMSGNDAGSYGISLSFWENGVLLGLITLVNLLTTYLIIAYGSPQVAGTVSDALRAAEPGLFSGSYTALRSAGLSGIERVSSLLAHFSWGFLVVLSAARKKAIYFLAALPMGLIDALVPYAGTIGIAKFELIIFLLSLGFLMVAVLAARREKGTENSTVA